MFYQVMPKCRIPIAVRFFLVMQSVMWLLLLWKLRSWF